MISLVLAPHLRSSIAPQMRTTLYIYGWYASEWSATDHGVKWPSKPERPKSAGGCELLIEDREALLEGDPDEVWTWLLNGGHGFDRPGARAKCGVPSDDTGALGPFAPGPCSDHLVEATPVGGEVSGGSKCSPQALANRRPLRLSINRNIGGLFRNTAGAHRNLSQPALGHRLPSLLSTLTQFFRARAQGNPRRGLGSRHSKVQRGPSSRTGARCTRRFFSWFDFGALGPLLSGCFNSVSWFARFADVRKAAHPADRSTAADWVTP